MRLPLGGAFNPDKTHIRHPCPYKTGLKQVKLKRRNSKHRLTKPASKRWQHPAQRTICLPTTSRPARSAAQRNKLVAEGFCLVNAIEKYGSGFIRIRKALQDHLEV
jgi:hypothetical protein